MLLFELFSVDFERWFAGSKVVDNKDNPLKCYHATNTNFNEFSSGSHFGDAQASRQRAAEIGPEYNTRTIPVYLKIKNPLRLRTQVDGDDEASLMNSIFRYDFYKNIKNKLDISLARSEGIYKALEKLGYDGLVYENNWDSNGVDSWVIFRPAQVRSAIMNVDKKNITEKFEKLEIDNKDISLLINPTANQLIAYLDKSKVKELRGIIIEENIYWWDAMEATHGRISAYVLGNQTYWSDAKYDNDARMHMKIDDGLPTIECQLEYIDNPVLINILKSDKIYFWVPSAGQLNYSEYQKFIKHGMKWLSQDSNNYETY